MKQLFALSIAMLLSTLFINPLSAQTTSKNCKPADCQKLCQKVCGKAVASKADTPSCTAKATTVAVKNQPAGQNPICSKVCPPECRPLCNKVAQKDGDNVDHWAMTVGLEEKQEVSKKASCTKPCKAKAKVAANVKVASN